MGSTGCIRVVFISINLLFLICGITLTVLSVVGKKELTRISNAIEYGLKVPSLFVMIVGIIIILVALFGIVAAICQNSVLYNIFAFFLILIFILQFVAAVLTFVMKTNVLKIFDKSLEKSFDKAYTNDTSSFYSTQYFDYLQKKYQCCGINNATDYEMLNKTIPNSCCPKDKHCSVDEAYNKGCLKKAEAEVYNLLIILAIVDIVFCFVTIIQITFTCCLVRSMKEYTRV